MLLLTRKVNWLQDDVPFCSVAISQSLAWVCWFWRCRSLFIRMMLSCKSQVCGVVFRGSSFVPPWWNRARPSRAYTWWCSKSPCHLKSGLVKTDNYYISISGLPCFLSHHTESTILSIMEHLVDQDYQRHYIVITYGSCACERQAYEFSNLVPPPVILSLWPPVFCSFFLHRLSFPHLLHHIFTHYPGGPHALPTFDDTWHHFQ